MTTLRRLARERQGAAIAEFALIAPVMLMTLFGLFDLGQGMYTKSLLQGAVEKASRDATIEGATTGALDAKVIAEVTRVAPGATVTFLRQSFSSFSSVGQPEDFTDTNSNGVCDAGETFEDANGNGVWDAAQGKTGNGGARDAVLYTVTVSYPRILPIGRLIGQPNTSRMVAVTVLRNQPYGLQDQPATGTCP